MHTICTVVVTSDAENDVENADAADDDIRSPLLATSAKNGSLN